MKAKLIVMVLPVFLACCKEKELAYDWAKEAKAQEQTPLQARLAEKRRQAAAEPKPADEATKRTVKSFIERRAKLFELRERYRNAKAKAGSAVDGSAATAALGDMAAALKVVRLQLEASDTKLAALAVEADDTTTEMEIIMDDHAALVAAGIGSRTATEFATRSDILIAEGQKKTQRLAEITKEVERELAR